MCLPFIVGGTPACIPLLAKSPVEWRNWLKRLLQSALACGEPDVSVSCLRSTSGKAALRASDAVSWGSLHMRHCSMSRKPQPCNAPHAASSHVDTQTRQAMAFTWMSVVSSLMCFYLSCDTMLWQGLRNWVLFDPFLGVPWGI